MSQHSIDDLIRTIDRETFSEAAHGAGVRVVLAGDKATLYQRPGLFGKFFDVRANRHVFVKNWSVPKEVKHWQFHWSEGTTAISLDFDASFVLQANEDVQALGLAKTLLDRADDAGEALYALINARLHKKVNSLLSECHGNTQTLSLLDKFRRSPIGIGESTELNDAVSKDVAEALGGPVFRIGFQVRNLPPMQIELRSEETFRLADSKLDRKVETTALLRLDNYQVYQKSRLDTEAAVQATMKSTVARIVKQHLFSRNYYDIVRSFKEKGNSIAQQMEASIQAEALTIGFRVEMFQTFPDIAALKLLEPTRVDIPAEGHKYSLSNSTGFVQVEMALSVKVASNFARLHLLIPPDTSDIVEVIAARVRQICRDNIQRFDHRDFNLNFDKVIVPKLRAAIVKGLAAYGLDTEVVHIRALPTEDASRFLGLRGRTIDFRAMIVPKADGAVGDPVPVVGTIEVIGMAENGWAQFEGKDFGFRRDSPRSEATLRALASDHKVAVPEHLERRGLAIEVELAEIRKRVVDTLHGAMEMGPQLALHWSNWESSQDIVTWAQKMAASAIGEEFGLTIALRGMRRLDTAAEETARIRRLAEHEQLRQVAAQEARANIDHQHKLLAASNENDIDLVKKMGKADGLAAMDESNPEHAKVVEKARHLAENQARTRPRAGGDASDLLPVKPPSDSQAPHPWDRARKDHRTDSAEQQPSKLP